MANPKGQRSQVKRSDGNMNVCPAHVYTNKLYRVEYDIYLMLH